MISTSKNYGMITNLVGFCKLYGVKESYIKSHNFDSNLQCTMCNTTLYDLRKSFGELFEINYDRSVFLSCEEIIIKRLLE